MTLDLVKVAEQLSELISRARRERELGRERRERALELLAKAAKNPAGFDWRVLTAQTSWPLARTFKDRPEPLDAAFSPPDPPAAYAALAVDGSSIDVDRHLPVDCYVLNFGWMELRYGVSAAAVADTEVDLQPTGAELALTDTDDPSRESAVTGAVLSVVRSVRELALLSELAEARSVAGEPLLALVDGNLALWNLDNRDVPRSVAKELKEGELGIIVALDRLRDLAEEGRVVFSGFVSRTGAANLANSLRLQACPMLPQVNCRSCPGKAEGVRPCDEAGLASDGELMIELLAPWQRSAVFEPYRAPHGQTAEAWYEEAGHRIVFFYLRAEDEIARVELPAWMAADPDRLGLLHALLVHQACEGDGYPVALREAHEQAVISTGDRLNFAALLERECEHTGIPWLTSAKAASKRIRTI
jgi:hypothetical protein